jgi:hypothetical protein
MQSRRPCFLSQQLVVTQKDRVTRAV